MDLVGRSCILFFPGGIYKDSFCLETGYVSNLQSQGPETNIISVSINISSLYGNNYNQLTWMKFEVQLIYTVQHTSVSRTGDLSLEGQKRVNQSISATKSYWLGFVGDCLRQYASTDIVEVGIIML